VDSIIITPPNSAWVEQNRDFLSPSDIESIEKDGIFEVYYSDRPHHEVCSACGSDQDYDDEGNNITAL